MKQVNFPFVGDTRKPQAATAFAMRSFSSEVEAVIYDADRYGLKHYYIASCMPVHEGTVSKWCKGKRIPDKRLERWCVVTGSTALKQFRQRAEDEAADAKIETPAQKATRLINMENAA